MSLEYAKVSLDSLHEDPANARKHPDENLADIRASLKEFNQVEPLIVQKSTNKIIGGNGRYKVMRELGWKECDIAYVDVDNMKAAALGIALNRAGERAEWDKDVLDKLLAEMDDVGEELAASLKELEEEAGIDRFPEAGDGGDEFDATPADGPTRCKTGDLWLIGGKHRLLIGDSTKTEDVERLMGGEKAEMVWTDPPYGVAIGDKNKFLNSIAPCNRVEENLQNDTLDEAGLQTFLMLSIGNTVDHCKPGAGWYVAAPAGPLHLIFGQVLNHYGIWRQTIQWVKNNATFSPMGVSYHWQAEPIFYGWLPNAAKRYHGDRKQTTVWNFDRPSASPDHPTMKPVALVENAISHASLQDELVLEPFMGSGTTLIAAHRLNRRCYGMEIEPKYGDVILKRAEAEGLTCELLTD